LNKLKIYNKNNLIILDIILNIFSLSHFLDSNNSLGQANPLFLCLFIIVYVLVIVPVFALQSDQEDQLPEQSTLQLSDSNN
jgi:hypothetical protein